MNVIREKFMWKYIVEDNFLTKDHFDFICNKFNFDSVKDIYTNTFYIKDNTVETEVMGTTTLFSDEFILELYQTYNTKLLKILEELAPEKVSLYRHTRILFSVVPSDYYYRTHTDVPNKLLSVVIYLKPSKNNGTFLYESVGSEIKKIEIEWRQNRALIFSRSEKTFHSFESDRISPRYTLVYTLDSSKNILDNTKTK